MSRPNNGQVLEHLWKNGSTITFRARVHAYGVRTRVTFGTSDQGWNRKRAEIELEKILQQVERGTWVPPALQSKEDRRTAAMAELGVRLDERFSVFATRWWKSKRLRVAERTISDYEWRLAYLQRFFGRYELNQIDVALVDRFRDELHEQAATTRAAAARGRPLIETVTDRRVGTYKRHRRALSNTSINAMLKLLGQILQHAVDYDLIARNPVRVGERGQRYLPRVKPLRTFLEVDEFQALLDAAGELDAQPFGGTRQQVHSLKAEGQSVTEIARGLGLTSQSVCYHLGRSTPPRLGGRRAILASLGLGGFRSASSVGSAAGMSIWLAPDSS